MSVLIEIQGRSKKVYYNMAVFKDFLVLASKSYKVKVKDIIIIKGNVH